MSDTLSSSPQNLAAKLGVGGVANSMGAATKQKPDRIANRFVAAPDSSAIVASLFVGPSHATAEKVTCQIADLHLGGCALRYQTRAALETALARLHVADSKIGLNLEMIGHVCWSRQTGLGTFTSGFQFHQPLSPKVIDSLLRENRITRRVHHRVDVDLPVAVRQNLPSLSLNGSRLASVSPGGVQLTTSEPLELKSKLLLILPNGTTAVATTVWCVCGDDDFSSGAKFVSPDQGRHFHDVCVGR
ncbi:PilZ domain-containing protein [Stieleria varia]|uniref:PilZ domain protein n=1 Tax=Stieleria varia TaxID=2528005 RepID=A0A5C6B6N7_9BACT|nr:PilZ domain-containing protein [Stieleria varia]TWU07618.1 PilZ domain protein [Stieleria varia]